MARPKDPTKALLEQMDADAASAGIDWERASRPQSAGVEPGKYTCDLDSISVAPDRNDVPTVTFIWVVSGGDFDGFQIRQRFQPSVYASDGDEWRAQQYNDNINRLNSYGHTLPMYQGRADAIAKSIQYAVSHQISGVAIVAYENKNGYMNYRIDFAKSQNGTAAKKPAKARATAKRAAKKRAKR